MKEKIEEEIPIERLAQERYNPDLPYHNFDHTLESIKEGQKIVARCKKEGIEINENVVYYALLFHDAGYHEDHIVKGFDSKEEYSSHLAGVDLEKMKVNKEIIKKVQRSIISTRQEESFKTNEEKAVRAADLAGLAGDYDEFLENNKKLREEQLILTGVRPGLMKWKEETKKVIKFYLAQNINLTSQDVDKDGRSIFRKQVRRNLKKFLKIKIKPEDMTV